jgi:hypothetical protein
MDSHGKSFAQSFSMKNRGFYPITDFAALLCGTPPGNGWEIDVCDR